MAPGYNCIIAVFILSVLSSLISIEYSVFVLQLLLSLAKSLFEEQMSLERLVSTIITEAKSLLTCERCTVYLLDLRMYDAVRKMYFIAFMYSLRLSVRNGPMSTIF